VPWREVPIAIGERLLSRSVIGAAMAALVLALSGAAAGASPDCRIRGDGRGTPDDPYVVPRCDAAMTIDALLDEPAWGSALVLALNYEVQPGENVPPPVETEVLLTYDRDNLYAAFRCYDPDPSAVTAHISDRDDVSSSDDWVALILDTFNDERRSFDVLVNAAGVQEDFVESSTGGGSWDAIWDSAARVTDWGYVVELSVPFKQLRFQRSEGPQIWSFDAVRSYPREHRHHIGAFPRDRGNNCYLCQAVKVSGFEGATPGRNIEIAPTLTGVRAEVRDSLPSGGFSVETEGPEFWPEFWMDTELGVTAKWGVTPNLTLSAAGNPDFSQIEADALELDINQPFALYFSEKRPFFLEGIDFFSSLKNAFHSRAIRDPLWGVKLTGKEGIHTIGVGVMQDEVTDIIIPGSESSGYISLDQETTDSVVRYKLDIGNRYTVGAFATDRRGDGYRNTLAGADCDLRITRSDQVQLQGLWSSTQYPESVVALFGQKAGPLDDTFLAFEYDHDGRDAYWWLDYDVVGPDFRADLGHIPRVGFRNVEGGLMYNLYAEPPTWWSRVTPSYDFWYYEDWDHGLLQKGSTLSANLEGALQSGGYAGVNFYQEGYGGEEYDLVSYHIEGGFLPTRDLNVGAALSFGDRIDYANGRKGDRVRLAPSVTANLGRHLETSLSYTHEHLDVEPGRLYTANSAELRAVYQFNTRTFVRAIVQYWDVDRDPDLYSRDVDRESRGAFTQFLFSYKVNPQTVLFVGYSDDYLGGKHLVSLGGRDLELTQSDRTFFVKLGYAWLL
jgi:hypothetical protein